MARGARGLFSMGERLKAWWDQRSRDRLERTPPMDLLEGGGASSRRTNSKMSMKIRTTRRTEGHSRENWRRSVRMGKGA